MSRSCFFFSLARGLVFSKAAATSDPQSSKVTSFLHFDSKVAVTGQHFDSKATVTVLAVTDPHFDSKVAATSGLDSKAEATVPMETSGL